MTERLRKFELDAEINGEGPPSVVLVITKKASEMTFPLKEEAFLTPRGGQVSGLSGTAVQGILKKHGITQTLAEEGGRTSRGSIERMRSYVLFLNKLKQGGRLNFEEIEEWWVARVKDHFATLPLKITIDNAKSISSIVSDLLEEAFTRQHESAGTMFVGAVMQHLVGAKRSIAMGEEAIVHHGFSWECETKDLESLTTRFLEIMQ